MDGYPSVGSIIAGRYRIDALLGEGGMGAVFRASDSQGNPFALKFPAPEIRSRPGMMSRFANEAVAASRIASEHAVHIFGVEATEGGVPFIVMELLQGTDLDQIIETQAPVDTPRAVHFALQILRALQVAHAAGVVHRDMKPSNCFVVSHNGEPDFIKIIDFGITKLLGDDAANQTRTSVTMGTPAYMSPEQARSAKAAEPRSDLYAVGVILYELLTKKRPYDGDSHNELVVKICTEPPMPIKMARADLPNDLAAAVERALVKAAAGRYENAQAFARALAPFADARSAGVLQRIESGVQGTPLAAALAPTPLASNPGAPPPSPGNRTAIMEPGTPFADAPPASPPGREPQRTVVADAPIAFSENAAPPPAAALPPSAAPAVVPAAPMYESRPSGGGGGRGGLIAVLGVLAVGLIVGGLYFGGVFGGGSSAAPAPTPATASNEEGGDDEPTKKKKKKSADEPDEPEPTAQAPDPAAPTPPSNPTATKPAATKPTTTSTTTASGSASAPKPSTSTPGTTTAPTIVLPPGFPFPTGSTTTTAPPPATTTAPPPATTTAPPPATTTAAPPSTAAPTMTIPVIKKPKIGGS